MLPRQERQDGEPNASGERSAPALSREMETGERPAPVAALSPAKKAALLAFLCGDGTLHKSRGVWTGQPAKACDQRIYGITIADLARDGMLTLTKIGKSASAQLTARGSWFARTLAAGTSANELSWDT